MHFISIFCWNQAVGGNSKNKHLRGHFYFYSDFGKIRVREFVNRKNVYIYGLRFWTVTYQHKSTMKVDIMWHYHGSDDTYKLLYGVFVTIFTPRNNQALQYLSLTRDNPYILQKHVIMKKGEKYTTIFTSITETSPYSFGNFCKLSLYNCFMPI